MTTNAEKLTEALQAHGIVARHVRDYVGPTVTQHAFDLTAGTSLKRLRSAAPDLALAVGQESVLIAAPIPGTSYVGIEVPGETRETVTYADFVGDSDVTRPDGLKLPIPIGVDLYNDSMWADLTELPHLLVAGTTRSGKSVAITSALTSLIDHTTPDELRLWLVDPKRVELSHFADAPHVQSVATTPLDTLDAIREVEDIMDRRYKDFEDAAVRNIEEWNAISGHAGPTTVHGVPARDLLPYAVLVVDEFADLMLSDKSVAKEAERRITRIAQLGRAAGVHLLLATQRPTRDVVTGLIAANIPSRWCFAVQSHVDSTVALGETGAQTLLGQGDSLWKPSGSPRVTRVQAVYTSNEDIATAIGDSDTKPLSIAGGGAAESDDSLTLEDLGIGPHTDEDLPGMWEQADLTGGQTDTVEYDGFGAPVVRETAEERAANLGQRIVAKDRSTDWLADWKPTLTIAEPDTVVVHDRALMHHLAEVNAKLDRLQRRSGWRGALRTAGIVVGSLMAIGWTSNLVEAIVR